MSKSETLIFFYSIVLSLGGAEQMNHTPNFLGLFGRLLKFFSFSISILDFPYFGQREWKNIIQQLFLFANSSFCFE